MSIRHEGEIPHDTTPDAAVFQERLFLEMEPARRMRAAFELSEAARRMTLAGLQRRNEELSDEELHERFIELCYGRAVSR